ncbi:hypothetical protein SAMN05444004_1235 [Jannaschia faecimaris]|uniref:Uncharacterized protein n=1 Tax=Jannaschia faecimaris TaxID=1244108 RepID=A0A1H3U3N0_9RHOB|nr:hypothetical protein [Jannaschia faecimaris]SDZ57063.1 hypothetical protein SAMN05444004_1235 [Jannaschia faecimaris]
MKAYCTPGALVADLSRDIIANAAALRQGRGRAPGERPAPSLIASPVDLVEIFDRPRRLTAEEAISGARPPAGARVTAPGARTAVRREPKILSRLPRHDGRRLAVLAYASALERLGAVRGSGFEASTASTTDAGTAPDGGAATRLLAAATVRLARGTVNRWRWSRATRAHVLGPARPILEARRGKARTITATALLDGVVIEGLDMAEILTRAGWSPHSKHAKVLCGAFDEMLDGLADALGFGLRRQH